MAVFENLSRGGKNQAAPVAQMLLEAGAEVNCTPSENEASPLQAAIWYLHHDFVDILLERGANVDAYDPRHLTALAAAARRGELGIMKKLVARGADIALATEEYG